MKIRKQNSTRSVARIVVHPLVMRLVDWAIRNRIKAACRSYGSLGICNTAGFRSALRQWGLGELPDAAYPNLLKRHCTELHGGSHWDIKA
jgi:hypothetical protein